MTEENLYYLGNGKVVVYRRTGARSPNWYVRVEVEPTGRWKKFTTQTSDLEIELGPVSRSIYLLRTVFVNGWLTNGE